MQGSSRNTFFFAPPLALYRAYPEPRTPPDAEIDLCAVIDGQFVLGEVKESGREVNDRLGNTLISLANQIRPDQVVIACLDSSAQTALNVQAQRIGTALNTLPCSQTQLRQPKPVATIAAENDPRRPCKFGGVLRFSTSKLELGRVHTTATCGAISAPSFRTFSPLTVSVLLNTIEA